MSAPAAPPVHGPEQQAVLPHVPGLERFGPKITAVKQQGRTGSFFMGDGGYGLQDRRSLTGDHRIRPKAAEPGIQPSRYHKRKVIPGSKKNAAAAGKGGDTDDVDAFPAFTAAANPPVFLRHAGGTIPRQSRQHPDSVSLLCQCRSHIVDAKIIGVKMLKHQQNPHISPPVSIAAG